MRWHCLDVSADGLGDELETARRVWVRLSQGRGGTQRRTGWRSYVVPRGSSIGMPGYLEAYRGRMAVVAQRLANVSLECRPALELIEQDGAVSKGLGGVAELRRQEHPALTTNLQRA